MRNRNLLKFYSRRGTTFIDLAIAMGIIAVLFSAIFSVYFSILTSINNIGLRTSATQLLSQQIEIIRNLPYASVGTVGGVPAGIIPQQQTLSIGNNSFVIQADIRNIDDSFDGTLGGNPNDTAPNDYKLVTLVASCSWCANFFPLAITTTVAPKNLESAGLSGDLFINVLNAFGIGVPLANVQVTNASVTPSISLTDTTNVSGVLQLVGVPTSTQSYHIVVTKSGYSSDQTYPLGAPSNPHPLKPDATVAQQQVTSVTFLIDKTSVLNVSTENNVCVPVPAVHFSTTGSSTIGSNPTVYKFSTSSVTGAGGTFSFPSLGWDTYALSLSESSYNLLGTIPLGPLIINPSSTASFTFVLQSAANPSLLIGAVDAVTGAGLQNATVTITTTGFLAARTTGHAFVTQSNWAGGQYTSQNGINPNTSGTLTMMQNASGTYSTTTTAWLISNTMDLGSSSSTLYSFSWNPQSQPPSTGPNSVKFQLAANNDQATWNFIGPDGTAGSFYTASSTLGGRFDGNRYVRYEVYMSTQDANTSPSVTSASLEFNAICVPPAQTLFTNLSQGTYVVDVTAPSHIETTSTVSVGSGFNQTTISLTHT